MSSGKRRPFCLSVNVLKGHSTAWVEHHRGEQVNLRWPSRWAMAITCNQISPLIQGPIEINLLVPNARKSQDFVFNLGKITSFHIVIQNWNTAKQWFHMVMKSIAAQSWSWLNIVKDGNSSLWCQIPGAIRNKSNGKRRNTLGCLDQYACNVLRLWNSRDRETVYVYKYAKRMETMKQSGLRSNLGTHNSVVVIWWWDQKIGVNSDFKVKSDLEGQGQLSPKTIGILTKVFCIFGLNLAILAWTGPELSRGQASDWHSDWHTHTRTHTQTQAMTIPEGQNWPRAKISLHGQPNVPEKITIQVSQVETNPSNNHKYNHKLSKSLKLYISDFFYYAKLTHQCMSPTTNCMLQLQLLAC